ncbi:hypothetical protein P9112_007850 [Eukaryota sp. TZLM1-RC]
MGSLPNISSISYCIYHSTDIHCNAIFTLLLLWTSTNSMAHLSPTTTSTGFLACSIVHFLVRNSALLIIIAMKLCFGSTRKV